MPAEYKLMVERRMVLSRAHGALTNTDILSHARHLKREPGFAPDFKQFVDFSVCDPSQVTSDAVHGIRGNMNPFRPDAVRAMYAPDDFTYALCRMFQMLHADQHLLVTRSREEAERHVGLAAGESLRLWEAAASS